MAFRSPDNERYHTWSPRNGQLISMVPGLQADDCELTNPVRFLSASAYFSSIQSNRLSFLKPITYNQLIVKAISYETVASDSMPEVLGADQCAVSDA